MFVVSCDVGMSVLGGMRFEVGKRGDVGICKFEFDDFIIEKYRRPQI